MDATLCTHFIFAFAGLKEDNQIKLMDPKDRFVIKDFVNLKRNNSQAKVLISIGGWKDSVDGFTYSNMVSSPENRIVFIESAVRLISKFSLDGLDLDWEYPTQRGGRPQDKINFLILCQEIKSVFISKGWELTAAVGAGLEPCYDIPRLSTILNAMHLMTYDYCGLYERKTKHNTPFDEVEKTVKDWIGLGADPLKLVLGLALYGHSYSIENEYDNGLGAPVSSFGKPGKFTKENGSLGYNEICLKIKDEGWIVKDDINGPYAFKENQWVGFDNEKSIKKKASLVNKYNLGGGMVWSIETDDFRGSCHGNKFPLLKAIKHVVW